MVDNRELLAEKAVQSGVAGIAQPLTAFFASRMPEAANVQIAGIDTPPADSGFSAENFFVDLTWVEGRRPRQARYVVRRQAQREMFPGRSFSQERRIQDILSTKTDLPVPRILAHEDDPAVLDGRFYVMEHLPGATPPVAAPHEAGMLAKLSEPARRKLWFSGLDRLGEIHRLDPVDLGLIFVSKPGDSGSELSSLLDYWERHYMRSCHGEPLQLMTDAMAWLRSHQPEEREPSLVWGDARIGNMLFDDDQNCVGIVDWELASLGDPLQDLAYWTYSDDHFVHIASDGALPGWPTLEETVDAYERASGRAVEERRFKYYRLVAGYWIVCTLSQLVAVKKQVGQFPADLEVTEAAFSPVSFYRAEFEATLPSW
ncbi:MAG: phosphotransferase family protein [Gammaproteobacteria bacterium]|nr:phosphotransferase family protein [Gammaproteobacteria bacterium]